MTRLPVLALVCAAACEDLPPVPGGGDTSGASVSSCNWPDIHICYAFVDYAGTESWCHDVGDAYGVVTEFAEGDCPGDPTARCALPIGGDFDVESTAWYYAEFSGDPVVACESAGGVSG